MIVAYDKWGDREKIENGNSVRELVALYVKFHEEAEKDPSLEDEARAAFRRIELHEPHEWELFQWFKTLTLKDVARVYDLLGVTFDSYNGEAFYEDKMPAVVQELKDKGLTKIDNGMTIVDLSEYDMPPCIILKSDGSTIYATRDIAAAEYRKILTISISHCTLLPISRACISARFSRCLSLWATIGQRIAFMSVSAWSAWRI